MTESKTSLNNLLFTPIESVEGAKKARLPSLCLTAFGAVIWALIALNGLYSPGAYGYWAIAYSVVLALVAWGLYQMRKEAAVVALTVALIGLLSGGGYFKIATDMAMLLVAVAAIRGTFAYALQTRQAKVSEDV